MDIRNCDIYENNIISQVDASQNEQTNQIYKYDTRINQLHTSIIHKLISSHQLFVFLF